MNNQDSERWRPRAHSGQPVPEDLSAHQWLQQLAKAVLKQLATEIDPEDTEKSIGARAVALLRDQGIQKTWYYDCPALVLLGSRSCLSISGHDYRPSLECVGQTNLVSIDLSPSHEGHWGDCARSFAVEDGRVTLEPKDPQFRLGLSFLDRLQSAMCDFVTLETSFHELAQWAEDRLEAEGFSNLDFRGNVGHSIAMRRKDRIYIEAGNHRRLSEIGFFTFEPHVRAADGPWGFKLEDMFYFTPTGALERV